jgi:hypothetical protein
MKGGPQSASKFSLSVNLARRGSGTRGLNPLRRACRLRGRRLFLMLGFDVMPTRCGRPVMKFGSPALFAPTLKIQRDNTHNSSKFFVF